MSLPEEFGIEAEEKADLLKCRLSRLEHTFGFESIMPVSGVELDQLDNCDSSLKNQYILYIGHN